MPLVYLNQSDETLLGGNFKATWPACNNITPMPAPNASVTLPPIACNPGDFIVANRSPFLQVTQSDNSLTLTFGSSMNADGTFTGTASFIGNGAANPYSGPYASASPLLMDPEDLAWDKDIEIIGLVEANPDASGRFPCYLFTGWNTVYAATIADNQISENHMHASHHAYGAVVGPAAQVIGPAGGLQFVSSTPSDMVRFVTSDGSGDNQDYAAGGNPDGTGSDPGGYDLLACAGSFITNYNGYVSEAVIVSQNNGASNPQWVSLWPNASPKNASIAFCTLFPGGSSKPSVNVGGGSIGPGTYTYRFCYYKTLTLATQTQSGAIISGGAQNQNVVILDNVAGLAPGMLITFVKSGTAAEEQLAVNSIQGNTVFLNGLIQYSGHKRCAWGQYTQVIETPLSSPAEVVIGSGTTNSVSFSVPATPAGWDGVRIYQGNSDPATVVGYFGLAVGTNYTISGTTVTVTSSNPPLGNLVASHGWSAWPAGTLLIRDPNAVTYCLQRFAHVGKNYDPTTFAWPLTSYMGNVAAINAHQINVGAVQPLHAQAVSTADGGTATPSATNNTQTFDPTTGKYTWKPGGGSGSLPAGFTAGDMIYGVGSTPTRLPIASVGAIMASTGTRPAWAFPATQYGQLFIGDPAQITGTNWATANALLGFSFALCGKTSFTGNGTGSVGPITIGHGAHNGQGPRVLLAHVVAVPAGSGGGGLGGVHAVNITDPPGATSTTAFAIMASPGNFNSGKTYEIYWIAMWT